MQFPLTLHGQHLMDATGKGVARVLGLNPELTDSNAQELLRRLNSQAKLLLAAKGALDILKEVAIAESGVPEQDQAEREAFDDLQAAVNEAEAV